MQRKRGNILAECDINELDLTWTMNDVEEELTLLLKNNLSVRARKAVVASEFVAFDGYRRMAQEVDPVNSCDKGLMLEGIMDFIAKGQRKFVKYLKMRVLELQTATDKCRERERERMRSLKKQLCPRSSQTPPRTQKFSVITRKCARGSWISEASNKRRSMINHKFKLWLQRRRRPQHR